MMDNSHALAAREAASRITSGELSSETYVNGYLEQIDKDEETVGAWTFCDRESVIRQARMVDGRIAEGKADGLVLNGVPVGVKDIFDTSDMPTENGTSAHAGRQPEEDAEVVRALRRAGAVIMGKTVTAELAVYSPGKTVNPHDPTRTPGGSSSGSAAAVAAGMVPLAIGTQTNGSVIRPASYCGVIGFKPTMGTIPRSGILKQAPSLDQVGVFSTNVMDSALLAKVLMEYYTSSSDGRSPQGVDPSAVEKYAADSPRLGFCRTPVWPEATEATRQAFLDFLESIEEDVAEIDLSEICAPAVSCHKTIMLYEMFHNYRRFFVDHHEKISTVLLGMLVAGQQITISAYLDAKDQAAEIGRTVNNVVRDFDAVLTPATPSEAPSGLESTGSPIFCTIWSLCGSPAISLPVLNGSNSMPLGLQLVGATGTDNRFLGAAEWLWRSSRSHTG